VITTLRFALLMAGLLAAVTTSQSAAFEVRRIVVTGAHALPPQAVAAIAGIARGRPLFAVRAAEAAARLQAHPRIRAARVGVRWPDLVVIEIVERVPRLAVRVGQRYALVGDDDVVVDVVEGPGGLPSVDDRVRRPVELRPGMRVTSPATRAARLVVEALPAGMRARLARVVVGDGGDLVLEFSPGPVVRAALRADLPDRLAHLPQVLEALRTRGIVPEAVDLRYAGSLVVTPGRAGDGR
jgi:cell division protein FtsQ